MANRDDDNLADLLGAMAGDDEPAQEKPAAPNTKPASTPKPRAETPVSEAQEEEKLKPAQKKVRRPMPTPQPKGADGQTPPAAKPKAAPVEDDEELEVEGVLEDEADTAVAASEPEHDDDPLASLSSAGGGEDAPASRPAARRTPIKPRKKDNSLKATAIPILFTVGGLLLIPAIWAVRILNGSETAWGAERESASGMAKLMLAAWPLAAIMIVSALVLIVQMMRDKKNEKAGA